LSTDEALNRAVEQAFVVMTAAQKRFSNSLSDYLAAKNIVLPPDSKEYIEKLFVDTFQTYFMAEMPAFLSFVLYDSLKNADILTKLAPEFLDACEVKIGAIPEPLIKKTIELPGVADNVLKSGAEKSDIVKSLCHDLASMDKIKGLRASFDALLLTLWGE
jgi:hypothetical protein